MKTTMLSYIKEDSPIHNLTGATKLICLYTLDTCIYGNI